MRLRQIGVILLLMVTFAAPAMACMTPETQMTSEEKACCRMMKNQCEQGGMSGAHDCCKKAPKAVFDIALKTNALSFHPVAFVAVWASSLEILAPRDTRIELTQRPQYPPPKSPPAATAILRI